MSIKQYTTESGSVYQVRHWNGPNVRIVESKRESKHMPIRGEWYPAKFAVVINGSLVVGWSDGEETRTSRVVTVEWLTEKDDKNP